MLKSGQRTRWGLERGNVNLSDRPVVQNPGGSFSTIKSGSYNIGGKEVLLPHVGSPQEGTYGTSKTRNAKLLTPSQAKGIYKKTGQHLGKFRTPTQADQFANAQHRVEEKKYTRKGEYKGKRKTNWNAKKGMWE